MNNNLEFENEDPCPDSIEDNHPRTNYGEGYNTKESLEEAADKYLKLYHSRLVNKQQKEYERELFKDVVLGYKTSLDAQMLDRIEPKQETLEEAAEKLYPVCIKPILDKYDDGVTNVIDKEDINEDCRESFMEGAKWQQDKMYSEEEVKMLAFNFYYDMSHKMGVAENLISENRLNAEEWFEQFKKKIK